MTLRGTTFACTAEEIDMTFERWNEIMSWPDLCQQFPCSEPADRECGYCRSLFCPGHATHDCLRAPSTCGAKRPGCRCNHRLSTRYTPDERRGSALT